MNAEQGRNALAFLLCFHVFLKVSINVREQEMIHSSQLTLKCIINPLRKSHTAVNNKGRLTVVGQKKQKTFDFLLLIVVKQQTGCLMRTFQQRAQ